MNRRLGFYFLALSTFIAGGTIAEYNGLLSRAYAADATHLTAVIAAGGAIGMGIVPYSRSWARWLADNLVMLGLVGTILGFIVALAGIGNGPTTAGEVARVVSALVAGLGTSLYTTLAGSVSWLGIEILAKIMEE